MTVTALKNNNNNENTPTHINMQITDRTVTARVKLSEAAARRLMHMGACISSCADRPSQRSPRVATLVAHSPLRTLPPRWPAHEEQLSTTVARATCACSSRMSEGARRVARAQTTLAHALQPLLPHGARLMAICADGTQPRKSLGVEDES